MLLNTKYIIYFRAVQINLVTRPTRRTDQIRPESSRPDCSGGSAAGLHYQKLIPVDRFRFSSLKTRKTRTDRNISRLRPKFPYSDDSFPESDEETQIPVMFPLDLVRFWTDQAISHQIQWYVHQNLNGSQGNIAGIWKIITEIWVSLPDLCFFHRFLAVVSDLWLRPTRLPPVGGLNRLLRWVGGGCIFFPPDSDGSVPGWAQTRPGSTRGQP